jgi:hypothetical protein
MDDIIYYKGRIFLVPKLEFKGRVLKACHESPLAGHQGFVKTYRQVRERFAWRGMKDYVMRHIRECSTCQENKDEHTHPTGLLQPLPILEHKWESISMDFITRLPKVQGKYCIFVVVDMLTKFAHFLAIATDYSASQVAKLFFREIFRECSTCQENKDEHTHPAGLLQPLPILEHKWESISMDFITRLPKVQGKDCIFVVVDRLTKFAHFLAIATDYSASQVAKLFFREIFRLHGLSKTIVSDRDNMFMSTCWHRGIPRVQRYNNAPTKP